MLEIAKLSFHLTSLLASYELLERIKERGYKHSLAEKDTKILRLKAYPIEFASFFRGGFQGLVRKFLASDEFSMVQALMKLEPDRFARQITVLAPRVVGVSLPTTKNKEWLSAMVDTTNEEMVGAASDNSVQGIVYQLCHEMNRVESSSI
nr:hypothetical protein [Tanacetum cinerariifolium]